MSIDGQWYDFIADSEILLANAAVPSIVGTANLDTRGADGYPSASAPGDGGHRAGRVGGLLLERIPSPAKLQTKHSWIVAHDVLYFRFRLVRARPVQGPAGHLHPGLRRARNRPATTTQGLLTPPLDYYNSAESVDGAVVCVHLRRERRAPSRHAADAFDSLDLPCARCHWDRTVYPTGLQVVADATPDGRLDQSYSWVNHRDRRDPRPSTPGSCGTTV